MINNPLFISLRIQNMNIKIARQRPSQSETPSKKTNNNIIQLSQYFSRQSVSSTQQLPIHNQNLNPNHPHPISNNKNARLSDLKSPKKKVIHIKSISRNSRSLKNQNSNSAGKQYYSNDHHLYTEIAPFDANQETKKAPVVIELDLYKHRRSIQDTITSSHSNNLSALSSMEQTQIQKCDNHPGKTAAFTIKGKPYCKICSVKLITQGFIAVRIDQNQSSIGKQSLPYSSITSEIEDKFRQNGSQLYRQSSQSQIRDQKLKQFIEEMQKIEPIFDQISFKIDNYSFWVQEYYEAEHKKLQQQYQQLFNILSATKQNIEKSLHNQQQKSLKHFAQLKKKINLEMDNLHFMRDDIVGNVDQIVDGRTISVDKFGQVMQHFKRDLQTISRNALNLQNTHLNLPIIHEQTEDNLVKEVGDLFVVGAILKEINLLEKNRQQQQYIYETDRNKKEKGLDYYQCEDPYRLSFGKEMEMMGKVRSPTFKVV